MKKTSTILSKNYHNRKTLKNVKVWAKALTDAELLAVIIRTGSKYERSIDLASKVLNLILLILV